MPGFPKLPAFLVMMAFSASAAWASEPFRYEVSIDAPVGLGSLLTQHLEIVRAHDSGRMTEEQLDRLVEATPAEASGLLETEGYFSPEVSVDYQKGKDIPRVNVHVATGEPTQVTSVDLVIYGAIASEPGELAKVRARIFEAWTLPVGRVFRQSDWDAAKKRSLSLLQERKYAAARVRDSEARIDPSSRSAALKLVLDSGEAYRFGPLSINGLRHYPKSLVGNEARFVLGGEYQRDELTDLQSNLQNLAHFSFVVVDTEIPETAPFEVPVRVEVREAPRHKLSTELGYSSNTGFKSELGYRYLNLAGRGWISESKLRFDQHEQAVETAVTFPRQRQGYEHRIHAGYLRSDIEGLLSHTLRTGIARQREDFNLSQVWSAEYLTEQRELGDGTRQTPKTLAAKFNWLQRKVDNVRDPRRGRLLQLEAGGAWDKLLSDATFLRLYGRGVNYLPLGQRGVLIARGEIGETFSTEQENVPTEWLFRTGGAGSVRGYDYQSLGVQSGSSVLPGRVMATASIEYQIPVYRDWRAAAFVDHGGAGERWQDFRTVTGAGLGARWVSPAGVLGLDFARGIDERQWRLHIALGLAF